MAELNLQDSLTAASKTGLLSPKFRDGELINAPLSELHTSRFQPRTSIDEEELLELVAQIRSSGLLQPIGVRPRAEGGLEIVFGHRRVEAFKRLAAEASDVKWSSIQAKVFCGLSDAKLATNAYVENQRENLTPLEEALHLARMLEQKLVDNVELLAKEVGQPLDRVKRLVRLAGAPSVVKAALHGVLVVIGQTDDGKEQRERRSLDLLAALAFQRLWVHIEKAGSAKKADERTEKAIRRALIGKWGKRRVEEYVQNIVDGRDDVEASEPTEAETVDALVEHVFSRTPRRFVIELRKGKPTAQQLTALRAAVEALLAELGSQEGGSTGAQGATVGAR